METWLWKNADTTMNMIRYTDLEVKKDIQNTILTQGMTRNWEKEKKSEFYIHSDNTQLFQDIKRQLSGK